MKDGKSPVDRIYADMEVSYTGGAPNHPNLEHFRLETNGFGDPPF